MVRLGIYRALAIASLAILSFISADAQDGMLRTNPNFGRTSGVPSTNLVPVPSTAPQRNVLQTPPYPNTPVPRPSLPSGTIAPGASSQTTPPAVSLGAPSFDAYQSQGTSTPFPSMFGGGGGYNPPPPAGSIGYPIAPQAAPGTVGAPQYNGPLGAAPSPYPPSVYPNTTPPAMFPGGLNFPQVTVPGGWNPQAPLFVSGPSPTRFFQGPRFQWGWIYSPDRDPASTGLEVHEFDWSLAFAFPQFLGSSQPLYVLPSFNLTLFDGGGGNRKFYDAFLEAGWQTDPNYLWGLEMGTRLGVYSDFETSNSDSFRVQALLLGKMRLTPTATLKLGAIYLDRIEQDIIPAGGILWQPNPNQRWDLYFPEPKIACYCSTVGQQDVWKYVKAEFGGGSWTSSNLGGARFDYRDTRLLFGLEWGRNDLISSGRRLGFVEAGYVFNRKFYSKVPFPEFGTTEPEFDDSFMLRAGIGY